jgi:hypothetical protein
LITDGADIISIDAFRRSLNGHDFVVGITFVKTDKENTEMTNEKGNNTEKSVIEHYYLNIYASQVTLNDFDLEHIARNKLNKRFQFIIISIKN